MGTKYTDGPWYTSVYPGGDIGICQDDGNGHDICIVVDRQKDDPKDNAQLIAAAPELIEACRKALPWLGTLSNLTPGYITLPMDIEMLEQAIVKATGR